MAQLPGPPTKGLFDLPREIRDDIYGRIAANERGPRRLKTVRQPFRGARVRSSSKAIAACKQVHDEYQDALIKHVSTPTSVPLTTGIILATVVDMQFSQVIDYLSDLSNSDLKTYIGTEELQIRFIFTSASTARRADLQEWLRFCQRTGVTAGYGPSPFAMPSINPRAAFVNIYDLFSVETGDRQEEKIFEELQDWYACRDYHHRKKVRFINHPGYLHAVERLRADRDGLRTSKTPAECLKAVRIVPGPGTSQGL